MPFKGREQKTMLHIQREILELAAEAVQGPMLPPPPEIETVVDALIQAGLLAVEDGRVSITDEGREAIGNQPG